ncbi:hypothetical protein SISNIDRAFT_417541 [Sistotremastrum niveocremeum HHB9708]|uniref:Uncharacterized protein n=1 Tax=Sistotremastrum niveocremeum HHB9708 TaxID=1314777 RepID=A0A164PLE1_9AGAM|nr:hypothetical protein SISNIDRAFT_417541 [Sistotremastrum niveocremeum HHB9708]
MSDTFEQDHFEPPRENTPDLPPPTDPTDTFTEKFPSHRRAGAKLGPHESVYQQQRKIIEDSDEDWGLWGPFQNEKEWDMAKWLASSGLSHRKMNSFLNLPSIQDLELPFRSAKKLFKSIDSLPQGPKWDSYDIIIEGDRRNEDGMLETETVELYHRDILECIEDILGDPKLKEAMHYAPTRVWSDAEKQERFYSDMWTGDWWWETQERLPDGSTIVPIIFATDKTKLSVFSGDKVAWPVYMTIGNISKDVRRKISQRAWRLVGYLPIAKMDCFQNQEARRINNWQLYHECMSRICKPLYSLGPETRGVQIGCADGFARQCYPFLSVFTVDHPERCLIACCKENYCPECEVKPNDRGEHTPSPPRSRSSLEYIDAFRDNPYLDRADIDRLGLRLVLKPFWRNLPVFHVYRGFAPDILHQLHKGVFHSHLVDWCCRILGDEEVDARFKSLPRHSSLRHFHKGISKISQWTGREFKEMEKVFVPVVVGAETEVVVAARAVLDFIYYASLPQHSTTSLQALSSSLSVFHDNKVIFQELGIREHFNIPKLHAMMHSADHIKRWGSLDGYNTETSERLHIDFTKEPYRHTNRKDFLRQQIKIMNRQEAIYFWVNFVDWVKDEGLDLEGYESEDDEESEDEDEDEEVEVQGGAGGGGDDDDDDDDEEEEEGNEREGEDVVMDENRGGRTEQEDDDAIRIA